jgi:hypothetical protein
MVGGSLRVLWLLPPTKTGHHIVEILLKVALNAINQIKSSLILLLSFDFDLSHIIYW